MCTYSRMNMKAYLLYFITYWVEPFFPPLLPCISLLFHRSPRLWNNFFSVLAFNLSPFHLRTVARFINVTPLVRDPWIVLDEPLINLPCPEHRIQGSFWPQAPSSAWLPAILPSPHPLLLPHFTPLLSPCTAVICHTGFLSSLPQIEHLSNYAMKHGFHGMLMRFKP